MRALKIPKTTAELQALLNDPKRCAEAIEAGHMPEVVRAYSLATVRPNIEQGINEALAEHGVVNRPPMGGPGDGDGRRRILNRQIASWAGAPGRQLDGEFADFGTFLRAVSPQGLARNGMPEVIRNLSSVEPSAGGFLVPEAFRAELLAVALDDSIVRSRATVIPMASSRQVVPGLDVTSHESSFFGGVASEWIPEGGTFTDSAPRFGRVVLEASKLGLRADVPNELLQDAVPTLDVTLTSLFGQAMAASEDEAFLTGSGVGQPLGVMNSPAVITVTKETDQPDGTIVYENLTAMFARVLSRSRRRAVWVASDECIPELLELSISVGVGGLPVQVLNERDGQFYLLGRPIFFSEFMPQLGQAGDIGLFDFGYYLIGDRAELRIESSAHVKFTTDETVFRAVQRLDGRAWLLSAITPANGGDSRSAFVILGAR